MAIIVMAAMSMVVAMVITVALDITSIKVMSVEAVPSGIMTLMVITSVIGMPPRATIDGGRAMQDPRIGGYR
jgi:hypothetical protein